MSPNSSNADCRVAVLTPPGRGAVATIVVDGADAANLIDRCFIPASARPISQRAARRIAFGRWQHAEHAEEVIVARVAREHFEVNCHGGAAAVAAIVDALVTNGATRCTPKAWLKCRAGDSIETAAQLALRDARTERTAGILCDQLRGALRDAFDAVVASLDDAQPDRARTQLEQLVAMSDVGGHLTKPWRVAVAGPPNVGKSSLINAILGYQRSITLDQPGTTRDAVTAYTVVDGWPIELIDTAGLREAVGSIEREGVERARRLLEEVDLTVLVFDAVEPWADAGQALVDSAAGSLVVANKCDLEQSERSCVQAEIRTSATSQVGIDGLIRAIGERLVPTAPLPGQAVPFLPSHVEACQQCLRSIGRGDVAAARYTLVGLL